MLKRLFFIAVVIVIINNVIYILLFLSLIFINLQRYKKLCINALKNYSRCKVMFKVSIYKKQDVFLHLTLCF